MERKFFMNVSLTKELESFVNELVKSGMYFSASEVVRDGLRLLKEENDEKRIKFEQLRTDILQGYEESKRGESSPLDISEIIKEGDRRIEQKNNGK